MALDPFTKLIPLPTSLGSSVKIFTPPPSPATDEAPNLSGVTPSLNFSFALNSMYLPLAFGGFGG